MIYQIYLVLDPGPKVQNIKIHLIIPYQESIIDVIWRPKTIGIHFVARFITEKLPKTSEVLKLIFLNNLETNLMPTVLGHQKTSMESTENIQLSSPNPHVKLPFFVPAILSIYQHYWGTISTP